MNKIYNLKSWLRSDSLKTLPQDAANDTGSEVPLPNTTEQKGANVPILFDSLILKRLGTAFMQQVLLSPFFLHEDLSVLFCANK